MSEVVKRLHLTVNYSVRDGLRTLDLYGRSPIEVDFIDDDNQRLSLEVTELEDGRIKLADFDDKYLTKQEKRRVIRAQYGDTIPTPLGQMVVHKTPFMDSTYVDRPITVTKEFADGHDERLPRHRKERRGQQTGVDRHHLDEQLRAQACRGRDQHADRRVRRGRHRRQAAGIGRDERLYQGAYAGHRAELGVVDSEIEGIKRATR